MIKHLNKERILMTHTQKKAPLRSFFAKMTLQWRLTALTTLLVTVACIFMYFFISHSAVSGMDDLHDYAIHIDQNDSSPITFLANSRLSSFKNRVISVPTVVLSPSCISYSEPPSHSQCTGVAPSLYDKVSI